MTTAASQGERKRLETQTERRLSGCGCPDCVRVIDHVPRCWRCSKPVQWHATRPWSTICRWCGSTNNSAQE